MPHRIVAFLFVVLLLGMQQAAHWHALGHLAGWAQRTHESSLSPQPSSDVCTLCALFASGSSVAPDSAAPPAFPTFGFDSPGQLQFGLTAAAPSFYRSRAPPSIS